MATTGTMYGFHGQGLQLPRGGGGMSTFSGSAPWGWARCCSAPQARNFAGKGTSYAEITAEMAGKHDDNGPLPLSQIQRSTGVSWYLGCLLEAWLCFLYLLPWVLPRRAFFRAACVK